MKKYLINLLTITAVFACIRFCLEYIFGVIPDDFTKTMIAVFWVSAIFLTTMYYMINE